MNLQQIIELAELLEKLLNKDYKILDYVILKNSITVTAFKNDVQEEFFFYLEK